MLSTISSRCQPVTGGRNARAWPRAWWWGTLLGSSCKKQNIYYSTLVITFKEQCLIVTDWESELAWTHWVSAKPRQPASLCCTLTWQHSVSVYNIKKNLQPQTGQKHTFLPKNIFLLNWRSLQDCFSYSTSSSIKPPCTVLKSIRNLPCFFKHLYPYLGETETIRRPQAHLFLSII